MASQQLCLRLTGLAAILILMALRACDQLYSAFSEWMNFWFMSSVTSDSATYVSSDSQLHKILKKRDVAGAAEAPSKSSVAVPPSKAQEFLAKLSRTKRNVWDRSRPDVQQWIMQFMYMGFDEQRLETDLSYWRDHARTNDHGRQHHYDENAPIGPRDPSSYRHGANVNYDYY